MVVDKHMPGPRNILVHDHRTGIPPRADLYGNHPAVGIDGTRPAHLVAAGLFHVAAHCSENRLSESVTGIHTDSIVPARRGFFKAWGAAEK